MISLRQALVASLLFPLALLAGCGDGGDSSATDAAIDAPSAIDAAALDASVELDSAVDLDAAADLDAAVEVDASAVPADAASTSPDASAQADAGVIVCGGRGGSPCPEGTFCDFPPESICGRADGPGVCRFMPGACIPEGSGVCGCDGTTYSNGCLAASAGVSVDYAGPCTGAADE